MSSTVINYLTTKWLYCYNIFIYPFTYLFTNLFQSSLLITNSKVSYTKTKDTKEVEHNDIKVYNADSDNESLFPPTVQFVENLTAQEQTFHEDNENLNSDFSNNGSEDTTVTQCSTNIDSIFVPLKNEHGELEFKLNSMRGFNNNNSSEEHLIPYLTPNSDAVSPKNNTGNNNNTNNNNNNNNNDNLNANKNNNNNPNANLKNGFISLSPVSSVKSSSSNNSNDSMNNETHPIRTDEDSEDLENDVSDSEKYYQCSHCDSKFKIRGYLTRHLKKHSSNKAYHCPFFDETSDNKCHQTGGFSRRDTFKTHLKARHFKYPPGVRSTKRTGMLGWCGICGEKFLNNEIWVERHIEMGLCPGLSSDYIRTLKIGKKKTGKHSKFLDVNNLDESLKLGTKNSNYNNNNYDQRNMYLSMSNVSTASTVSDTTNTLANNKGYLESPSSVSSSPPAAVIPSTVPISISLSNTQQQLQQHLQQQQLQQQLQQRLKQLQHSGQAQQVEQIQQSRIISSQAQPPVDIETLQLLIKQHELVTIVNNLKKKQEEAQQIQQLQEAQHLKQLQKLQQLQQLQQLQLLQLQLQLQQEQQQSQVLESQIIEESPMNFQSSDMFSGISNFNTTGSKIPMDSSIVYNNSRNYDKGLPGLNSTDMQELLQFHTEQQQHKQQQQQQQQQRVKRDVEEDYPSLDGEF